MQYHMLSQNNETLFIEKYVFAKWHFSYFVNFNIYRMFMSSASFLCAFRLLIYVNRLYQKRFVIS